VINEIVGEGAVCAATGADITAIPAAVIAANAAVLKTVAGFISIQGIRLSLENERGPTAPAHNLRDRKPCVNLKMDTLMRLRS